MGGAKSHTKDSRLHTHIGRTPAGWAPKRAFLGGYSVMATVAAAVMEPGGTYGILDR
jgi:hypothetical protein